MSIDDRLQQAVAAITRADALLIAAGAGMGGDSGLPDFRGNQGFWRASPPYQKLGLDFASLANPRCACLARPNVLMFGDWGWDDARASGQRQRLEDWLQSACTRRLAIIECGAGTAIPTVRRFCEEIALESGGLLVRINVREPEVP